MLNHYLKPNEIIYHSNYLNGKRAKKKDPEMLVLGKIFFVIAIVSFFLIFINMYILILVAVSLLFAVGLIGYYTHTNNLFSLKNEKICLEYALTNERFLLYDHYNKQFYEFPINTCNKINVLTVTKKDYGNITLSINSKHDYIPLSVDTDEISISNEKITLYNIYDPYKLKHQLEFAIYNQNNKINDISNLDNYLETNEKILFKQTLNNFTFKIRNKKFMIILIGFPILFIFLHETIFSIFFYFYIFYLIYLAIKFYTYYNNKNNTYTFIYAITNKRILFLDFTNYILYAGNLKRLSSHTITNYNRKKDVGDILFKYEEKNKDSVNSLNNDENYQQYGGIIFPEHYEDHVIYYNIDRLDCPTIRLYGINNPKKVIDTYIKKR